MAYLFPKDRIERGRKVILYGLGNEGKFLADRNVEDCYCDIVCIIDKNHVGQKYQGIEIVGLSDVCNFEYDYVLIGSKRYEKEMVREFSDKYPEDYNKIVLLSGQCQIIRNRNNIRFMEIDKSEMTYTENLGEYVRFRTLELVANQIDGNVCGEIAEAGVYNGDFASAMNRLLPRRKMYLYDTFEGFNEEDISMDVENAYTKSEYFQKISFKVAEPTLEGHIQVIKKKMATPDNVIFRIGNFPDTIKEESEKKFALVSLDMDLYRPTRDGLSFFYERLSNGGFIFMHDYNTPNHSGIRKAVVEFESKMGEVHKIPIPDEFGTLLITK